jgi:RND family efflux transporter MFP subunit
MNISKTVRSLGWVALGAAPLLLVACGPKAGASSQAAPPPPTVTVAPVEARELVEHEEVVGHTEAVERVEIRPRVSGYIQEVRFQSGQKVKKGDVLFVIDPRTRQADLTRAEADLQRAQVQFDNVEREAGRTKLLLESKAISVEEADTRTWKVADAKAALAAAIAARDAAKLQLEFCEVKSPIDGQVSRALVTLGNNVSGVDGATTLLTTVVSTDPVYVLSDVDEATVLRFKRLALENKLTRDEQGHVAVEMALADEKDFPRKGYIESVDNELNPNTGSILVRTVFPNQDGIVLPGMFTRVRIPVGQPRQTLLISDRAIGTDQSQKFVWSVTSSNTVAYRAVTIGPVIDGKRVIRSGLEAGERIIVNGLQRVQQPGMTVTPETQPKLQAAIP